MTYVEGNCPKCRMPLGEMPDPLPEGWVCFLCKEKDDVEQARMQRILEEARTALQKKPLRPLGEPVLLPEGTHLPPVGRRPKAQRWAMYYKMRRQGR